MDDAAAVSFIQSISDLLAIFQNLFQRQRPFLQSFCERLSFHTLHHQKIDAILLANVKKHADVWMIQGGDGLGFPFEPLLANRIGGKMRREDLDSDRAFESHVPCAIHLSHPARAQPRRDLIGSESCPCASAILAGIILQENSPVSSALTCSHMLPTKRVCLTFDCRCRG